VAADKPAKVLLATRSPIRQAGLEKVLREAGGFKAVGVCSSLASLEQRAQQLVPDFIVVDWDAQSDAGELMDALRQVAAHVSTVVLADHPALGLTAAMLATGVRGVIQRDSSYDELALALRGAAEGMTVLGTEAAKSLAERLPQGGDPLIATEELTNRELEVLELLAEGGGNREIGARLGISEHTVKFHISSILGKLSASNRTEAVAHGIRRGLIIV
jgi:NarL family two-component system response regulator YdfI